MTRALQVVSVLSLLSTCQPCTGKASTSCPSGQIPFYQPGCTALAHVMPGGNYGSQTVSCYTTTAAHQASASEATLAVTRVRLTESS